MAKVLQTYPDILKIGENGRTDSTAFFQALSVEIDTSNQQGGFPDNEEVMRNMLHWVACWARSTNTNSGANSAECRDWASRLINDYRLPPEPADGKITILNPDIFADRMGIA